MFKTWLNARINAKTERGATMVEYAIMIGLIAVVAIVIIAALGREVNEDFTETNDCLADPAAC